MPHFLKRLLPDLASFRRETGPGLTHNASSPRPTTAHEVHRTRRVLVRNPTNTTSTPRLSFFDPLVVHAGDESARALRLDGASIAASSIGGVGEQHILGESLIGEEGGRGEYEFVVQKRRARRRLSKRHRRPV